MSNRWRTYWRKLREGPPGRRFQQRYAASRRGDRRGVLARIVRITMATLAIAIGIVLVFIPGPAVLFFAVAGTLLASESLAVARLLDWSELKLRALVRAALIRWRRWSVAVRVLVCSAIAAAGLAIAWMLYRWWFG